MRSICKIFTIAILLGCYSCVPTLVSFVESEYYLKVYEDLPYDKTELFVIANKWMVGQFKSAKDVIQFSDKTEGVIIGRYTMFSGVDEESTASAIIEITARDNKTKIQIKPSGWKVMGPPPPEPKTKQYVATEGGKVLKEVEPIPDQSYGYTKNRAKLDMEKLGESFHLALLKKQDDF
jgi:hypothetical protein